MESSRNMLNSLEAASQISVGAGHTKMHVAKKPNKPNKTNKTRIQDLMNKIKRVPPRKQQAQSPNAVRRQAARALAARETREQKTRAQSSFVDDIADSLQGLRVNARKTVVTAPQKAQESIEDAINKLANRFQSAVGLKKQYKKNSAQIKMSSLKPKTNKNIIKKTVKMELEPTKRNPARSTRRNPERLTSSQLVKSTRASKAKKAKKPSPIPLQRRSSV